MSTMLLIERIPTLSIFARNHCGLGPTCTLSILRVEKMDFACRADGHAGLLISVFASGSADFSFFPVNCEISRAIPK